MKIYLKINLYYLNNKKLLFFGYLKMVHSMIDDYFKTFKECVEKYGEKTSLLYACGSFYEVYKVDNEMESIGNADKIAEILNIAYSKKNKLEKSTRSHPNFAGFTKTYLSKYITPLLENDYTVIVISQLETSNNKKGKLIKRGITGIYSKCLQPLDNINNTNYDNMNDTKKEDDDIMRTVSFSYEFI